jgi:hypothetical protein
MSPIIQVCVVVVTIAVVLLAYVGARTMLRLEATTKRLEARFAHLDEILEDSRQTSRKVRDLVIVLEQIAQSARSGVERVGGVVGRAASMSTAVLDEIERPVRDVVAVIRGLRSGVRAFTGRLTNGREPMAHAKEGGSNV